MVEIGDVAPSFSASTDGGEQVSLADFKGKKVILFFYPKDNTPGCTQESCDFRDLNERFAAAGVQVLGISKDSVKSHDNFKAKYSLNYPLISDPDTEICQSYGVWKEKKNYGKTYMGVERSTFLIDESGVIRGIWRKVRVKGHADAVLQATEEL